MSSMTRRMTKAIQSKPRGWQRRKVVEAKAAWLEIEKPPKEGNPVSLQPGVRAGFLSKLFRLGRVAK